MSSPFRLRTGTEIPAGLRCRFRFGSRAYACKLLNSGLAADPDPYR